MKLKIKILGRSWTVVTKRLRKRWGSCSSPDWPRRTIELDERLKGKKLMEIALHEMIHAAGWHIDETFVRRFARDAARVLHDQLHFKHEEP